jgi:putative hydrolase of the HAD superfamily
VLVYWEPAVVVNSVREVSRVDDSRLRDLWRAVDHGLGTGALDRHVFHRYLVEQAGTTADWDQFYDAFCRGLCRHDEMLAYAEQLHAGGVPIGIISNTNDVHTVWLREHVPEFARFEAVVFSSDVGLLKPDPAIFQVALERLAVAPQNALFVDDIEEYVAAAEALGLAGVVHVDPQHTQVAIDEWLARPEATAEHAEQP